MALCTQNRVWNTRIERLRCRRCFSSSTRSLTGWTILPRRLVIALEVRFTDLRQWFRYGSCFLARKSCIYLRKTAFLLNAPREYKIK
ncbi:hypothetical protein LCGC14_1545960 [marine sediment metagenome]|uniref:Uncharacterized protein n=1 Tax=marine sediment metagenome TaxID=412755 RepID=A0A0F9L7T1_9ZZZZ